MRAMTEQRLRSSDFVSCVSSPPVWRSWLTTILLTVLAMMSILLGTSRAVAQQESAVQEFTGYLEFATGDYYVLPGLEQGNSLSVFAEPTSGNLDPVVGIVDTNMGGDELLSRLREEYDSAIAQGLDPTSAMGVVAGEVFVAWNDDGEHGSAASLTYDVPQDGDYGLLILGSLGQRTFGDYRLLIGINAPGVTRGNGSESGDTIAALDTKIPPKTAAVDELTGDLGGAKPSTVMKLRSLSAGDKVYAYVETTSGDLVPVLSLQNYRAKSLLTDNYDGAASSAAIQYTVPKATQDLYLNLTACCGGDSPSGEYRLQVGVNAPEVLEGAGQPTEGRAVASPVRVGVGMRLDQITGVDQVSENFGAVVNLRMEWDDPSLAFDPDDCECFFQTFTPTSFQNHVTRSGGDAWPASTLFNQQGRRDEQGDTIVVTSDGHVVYLNRFTATLQAPDFDFRQFPFDKQTFHIRLRSIFPEDFYVFENQEDYTSLGEQLGEEEWQIVDWWTSVDTSENRSRYNFSFQATRHLDYYIYRIFLPLLVIILVSWAIFFLRNYERRVDASAGNLLLLIAFNFTISGNLPKLGYLTLLDVVLITTFVITGLALVINVYLKRLEVGGNRKRAERIDRWLIWLYPLVYLVMIGGIGYLFFVRA